MRQSVEWDLLLSVPCWTPVDRLPFEVSRIEDTLFKVGDHAFLIAIGHDAEYRRADIPNATMLVWAADLGVARRTVLWQIEADEGGVPTSPPAQLSDLGATYGEIIRTCTERSDVRYSVTAKYRIASDGRHIATTINTGATQYAFRSVNPPDDEPVVAIRYRLK